jgi:hypothetical protein
MGGICWIFGKVSVEQLSMLHPEVLLVPILMLADYFLTIAGALLYKRGYGKHVRYENYELNPMWQRSVDAVRWFNPRHLLITAFVTGFLLLVGEHVDPSVEPFYDFYFGLIATLFMIIVGRHLGNILIFLHAIKHPGDLSGEARLSYRVALKASNSQLWQVFLPLVVMAIYEKSAFALGCLCAPPALAVGHFRWRRKYQKQLQKMASQSQTKEEPPRPPSVTTASS